MLLCAFICGDDMKQIVIQTSKHEKIANWLDECRAHNTRVGYLYRISNFFEWYKKPVEEFLELSEREKRHVALRYQSEKINELSANSIAMTMGTINSFLDYYDQKISFKGKIVKKRIDLNSHVLTNGDLSKIFMIGNTKEKAFISLISSLGWEVNAVIQLKRKTLRGYIERAKCEGKKYFYFLNQRQKTGCVRLGVLNPLALKWVEKWLDESKNKPLRRRKPNRNKAIYVSDVFDISSNGCNLLLQKLTQESQIRLTGRIHTHLIRKWTMGNLVKAGLNEWEVRFLVGKSIPISDFTYLTSLQNSIEQKYPEAFEKYLNLETSSESVMNLSKSLEQKDVELKSQKTQLEKLQEKYDSLNLEKLLDRLQQLERKLQDKQ